MRQITFTCYKNKTDSQSKPIKIPWMQWIQAFSTHKIIGQPTDGLYKDTLDARKNHDAIILGFIPPTQKRADKNVEFIDALALDIDKLKESDLLEILKKLRRYEFVIYTTHKNGAECVKNALRVRIILPLQESLKPEFFNAAWNRLDDFTNNVNDPQTKNIGRLNFMPSTFDPKKAWFFHNEGEWLDPLSLPKKTSFDIQHQKIEQIEGKINRIRKADKLKLPLTQLLEGKPFAKEGERHSTLLDLTMWLAKKDSYLTDETLTFLFESSLESMANQSNPPTIKETVTAYQGAVSKLKDLIDDDLVKRQERAQKLQCSNQTPYTEEQINEIARAQNYTPKQLKTKWIVQKGGSYWMLTLDGYRGPYIKDEATLAMSQFLSQAPVRLVEVSKNGFKRRGILEVLCDSGEVVDTVITTLKVQKTKYDFKNSILYHASTPLRKIEPKFNEDIDKWLKLMGGTYYSKLVDWISCVPDLNKLLCAIYFEGKKNSGKTLLAHGLAKLWVDGPPANLEPVLRDFNDELIRCPLILADEYLPKNHNQNVTAILREMLSTTSRTLKIKYLNTASLQGCIRLILAANNSFLLENKEVATAQDLEAIAERFLYIKIPKEASEYLESLPKVALEHWLAIGIAQHALWLAQNHKVETPGKRFWVQGGMAEMHRMLMTGSFWNSKVCEWLVRYLLQPETYDSLGTELIRRIDGQLWVNDQALCDAWELILNTRIECDTSKIGAALRAISATTQRIQRRVKGRRIRYRVIDVDHLVSWAERYNIGDPHVMLKNLDRDENSTMFDFQKKKEQEGAKTLRTNEKDA